jgi:hypothetical protein
MVLNASQIELLHRLMRVAATDLNRTVSASWSRSRLRTVLVDDCIKRGLQVADRVSAALPPMARGATSGRYAGSMGDSSQTAPDLTALSAKGSKLLTADLHCGSFQAEASDFVPEAIYNSIARVVRGYIDTFLISADADIYMKLLEPDDKLVGRDATRIRVFESVLPPAPLLSHKEPRKITIDDTTLAVYGVRVTAFGFSRIVCAGCAVEP